MKCNIVDCDFFHRTGGKDIGDRIITDCKHPRYNGDGKCPLPKIPRLALDECNCTHECSCLYDDGNVKANRDSVILIDDINEESTPAKLAKTRKWIAELSEVDQAIKDTTWGRPIPDIGVRGFNPPKHYDYDMPLIVDDMQEAKQAQWDAYFMAMCEVTAKNSKCFSRQIGSVIVKDKSLLSSGYNGPPRGVPQCYEKLNVENNIERNNEPCCPRQKLGAPSGTMLELCYAQHAERNAITQAARNGTAINGATLYLNDIIPCKDCLGAIINAGIIEVVVTKLKYYDADKQGEWLLTNSNITVREAYDAG